jgi:hypothetical protein
MLLIIYNNVMCLVNNVNVNCLKILYIWIMVGLTFGFNDISFAANVKIHDNGYMIHFQIE